MAQFIVFEPTVEVSGEFVLAIINTYPPAMKGLICQLLENFGIKKVEKGTWYNQQLILSFFYYVYSRQGYNTLFGFGKTTYDVLLSHQKADSLDEELKSLSEKFKSFHRNGNCGDYRIDEMRIKDQTIIVCSKNSNLRNLIKDYLPSFQESIY